MTNNDYKTTVTIEQDLDLDLDQRIREFRLNMWGGLIFVSSYDQFSIVVKQNERKRSSI